MLNSYAAVRSRGSKVAKVLFGHDAECESDLFVIINTANTAQGETTEFDLCI